MKKESVVSQLFEMAGKYRFAIILGCIFAALSSILLVGPFVCIYYIFEIIIESGGVVADMDTGMMIRYGWMAVGLVVAGMLCYFVGLMCTHYGAFKTMAKTRYALMQHLISLPLGYHINNPSGKIRKVVDSNVAQTEGFLAHNIPDLAAAVVAPITIIVMMMFFDWRLGLLCIIPLIMGFAIQFAWVMKRSRMGFIELYQESLAEMENSAVEYVRGISVVKVFGQTVRSFKNFYDSIVRYKDYVLKYTMSMRGAMTTFMTLVNASFIFLIPAGIIIGQAATGNEQFVLSLMFYLVFTPTATVAMVRLLYTGSATMQVGDSVTRINNILEQKPLEITNDPKVPSDNEVVFDKVTFTYEGGKDPAIREVSFKAKEGTVTALVGPSGSGKSTIANLIPRFWDVDNGSVTIGGVDVRNVDPKELMDRIGYVHQESFLFKESIYDNILIGDPTADRERVLKAAEMARCNDIIEKFPDGIDTIIGTKGTYLSGGEKQRIALARVILKDPPIIVLDEATAFADPENEHEIQMAINELIKNKTVIMIAHRLSTVREADNIIVIDEGSITECGMHDQLLSKDGTYAAMWTEYQKGIAWNIKGAGA